MFLSIIIPIYNPPEQLLRKCIDSCLEQDIDKCEYEIICVDDGSTDNSLLLLKDYEKLFSNIKVITQVNSGVSVARNTGMSVANGDYVWFVDADDFIVENSLDKLKSLLFEKDIVKLNFGSYHFFDFLSDEENEKMKRKELVPNYKIRTMFVTRSLYKRSFLKSNGINFKKGMLLGEDQLFNFEVEQYPHKEFDVFDLFYFYRIHPGSTTHNSIDNIFAEKFIKSHIMGSKIVKKYYDNDKNKKIKTIRYLHTDLGQIMVNISKLEFVKAREYLREIERSKLFPYKKWISNRFFITAYTNFYSFNFELLCMISSTRIGFWLIKLWAKLWTSKVKKKIEKKFKEIFS